jgi:flagellar basal body rod protein FlgC
MHGMIDFSTPLSGLNAAESTVNRAASNIANNRFSGDEVDLSQEMVTLTQGQNDFAANVKLIQIEDQMDQSLLDITA